MTSKRQKLTNEIKRAEDFMKNPSNVDAAEFEFRQRVQEAKQRGENITQEGVRDYGRKHGWNTAKDEKIMDNVIFQEKIKSNPELYKQKIQHQQIINRMSQQIMIEGQKERSKQIKQKPIRKVKYL